MNSSERPRLLQKGFKGMVVKMPDSEKTIFLCPYCDVESKVSGTELYEAKKNEQEALIVCSSCGHASKLSGEQIQDCEELNVEDWSDSLTYDGVNSWLPCLIYEGEDAKLPSGANILPGDELTPRLWKYRTADLARSPNGSIWWTYDQFVWKFGRDPMITLYNMRSTRDPSWLAFITKNKAQKIEDLHLRTRIVVVKR